MKKKEQKNDFTSDINFTEIQSFQVRLTERNDAPIRNKVMDKLKLTPFYLARFVFLRNSLRQLRTNSSRRCPRDDGDDESNDERIRQREENQENLLYLHKSKGQHLLTNTRILDTIVGKSCIRPTDIVLEIGPGTGNLTLKLLEAAKKVVAVEIDQRMVEILNTRVAEHGFQDRLTVIRQDAIKAEFPQFDLVVANIPYNISSPLVAKLVYGANPFRSGTFLLQKEFARRLLANPGDAEFNRLAVNVKLLADVEFVMDVSKREFVPCPKVDSSVVIIRPKAEIPDVNLDEWWAFTRTCFSKKNKTLGATFKQKKNVIELLKLSKISGINNGNTADSYGYDHGGHDAVDDNSEDGESDKEDCSSDMDVNLFKERLNGLLKSSGFENRRPSKLSHEELLRLLSLFNQAGIYFHDHAKLRDPDDAAP